MGARRGWIVLGAAIVIVSACAVDRDTVDRMVLVGDSIGEEITPYLEEALDGTPMATHTYGGTAPCDWSVGELDIGRDDVVVLTFTGNSFTPCMEDGSGGHLQGDALVLKYTNDLRAIIEGIREIGAEVVLVGQPARGPRMPDADVVDGLNAAYQSLADELDAVSYLDAGAALETEDGEFAADLPCLPDEQECTASGRNPVRNHDGVHLCPQVITLQCDVYSSGAFRFAAAIAEEVRSR